ncbi:MAG: CHASE2 domain-containing protein [Rhizobiales bacterium]|nr:CHASE2 domain-containing protein [Hyphomicrobiales bacterium]
MADLAAAADAGGVRRGDPRRGAGDDAERGEPAAAIARGRLRLGAGRRAAGAEDRQRRRRRHRPRGARPFRPWPWPRDRLAELVRARPGAAAAKVVALDALLRETGGGDAALAEALAGTPSVIGAILDPDGARAALDGLSIVATGPAQLDQMMVTAGLAPPAVALSDKARSVGALTLPAPDGVVRAAPLLAGGGGALFAGLATEAVRVAQGEPTPLIESRKGERGQQLRLGEVVAPLPETGLLRLRFASPERRARRTIAAARLLDGEAVDLSGKIVLIGASAPEAGGPRTTPVEPFMPSVQIQADVAEQGSSTASTPCGRSARAIEAAARDLARRGGDGGGADAGAGNGGGRRAGARGRLGRRDPVAAAHARAAARRRDAGARRLRRLPRHGARRGGGPAAPAARARSALRAASVARSGAPHRSRS